MVDLGGGIEERTENKSKKVVCTSADRLISRESNWLINV